MLQKAYSTGYSQAVTHPSTNPALRCLTAVIRRELVFSTWYGRRQETSILFLYIYVSYLCTKRYYKISCATSVSKGIYT